MDVNNIKDIIYLKKDFFKENSKEILLSNQNINTFIIDTFNECCIVDFSKSENIELDMFSNIKLKEGCNNGMLISNEITANEENSFFTNFFCKIYRVEYPGNEIKSSLIVNNIKEYPLQQINSDTTNLLKENISSFRLKIKIDKSLSSVNPIIYGYSIFFKDSSIF